MARVLRVECAPHASVPCTCHTALLCVTSKEEAESDRGLRWNFPEQEQEGKEYDKSECGLAIKPLRNVFLRPMMNPEAGRWSLMALQGAPESRLWR